MRMTGYQPHYFPRLHYLSRVLDSDIFEISDYVQFVKKHAFPMKDGTMKRGVSYQGHSPIKLSHGTQLLVIPTYDKLEPLNQIQIVYTHDWAKKHAKKCGISLGSLKSIPGP